MLSFLRSFKSSLLKHEITAATRQAMLQNIFHMNFDPPHKLHKAFKFTLDVRESSIRNANKGVFVRGHVTKGDVVALYPGVYYPPVPVYAVGAADGSYCETACLARHMWDDSMYCIDLSDIGGYIDGKNITEEFSSLSSFAVGQMINHPNPLQHPNVTPFDFHWEDVYNARNIDNNYDITLEEYLGKVPVKLGRGPWFIDPITHEVVNIGEGSSDIQLPGLAMVAKEDICDGSELFLDYKLPPSNRPLWYHEPAASG